MKPHHLELNEFEIAILDHIAGEHPSIASLVANLHVLKREYTGVGSYTYFGQSDEGSSSKEQQIILNAFISLPNVPSGMGAISFCIDGKPNCLETFTHGPDKWDGKFNGFIIENHT